MTPKENGSLRMEDILISIKDNFDLAPSSVILSAVEQELSGVEGREDKFLQAIQEIKQSYDYIIIDCPPSIGLLCFNALRACDEVIIPIDMSLFSLRGVAKLMEIIILLKDKLDHDIKARALITMYDHRTRYSRLVMEKVKEEFGEDVFETVIRYNIRLRETVDYGLPIGDYDKNAIGNKDYVDLAEEVIRSETVDVQGKEMLDVAHDILHKTEEYIDSAAKSPIHQNSVPDTGFSPHSLRSSYSEMVEVIATESAGSIPEGDDEME